MSDISNFSNSEQMFIGRDREIRELENALFQRGTWPPRLVFITGAAGIGKTTILKHTLFTRRAPNIPILLDGRDLDWKEKFDESTKDIDHTDRFNGAVVGLDNVDHLNDETIRGIVSTVFNRKAVQALLIVRRTAAKVAGARIIELSSLLQSDAETLLQSFLKAKLSPEEATKAALFHANPLALKILAELANEQGMAAFAAMLTGKLYELSETLFVPSKEIIVPASSREIINATDALVADLRKVPESLYDLPPRNFEELLADLLSEMGYDVELTKATRDGGRDILAYSNTKIGRILCLVEAKRYRKTHKVGVELIRSLYGTFCDAKANSAMMVTTSSFTRDACEFQKRYEFQLSLKEYGDIVQWIHRYKS